MWIRLGGRWHDIEPTREAVWRHLVKLLRRQVEGAAVHGPPPPIEDFRYVQEPVATRGPRRGHVDDQWLCWWEVPEDQDGYLLDDCEGLSTAWAARAVLVDGLPVVPIAERIAGGGFHAVAGILGAGELLSRRDYYAGPLQATVPMLVVDPSYLRGMRDPRRDPACYPPAVKEGICQ